MITISPPLSELKNGKKSVSAECYDNTEMLNFLIKKFNAASLFYPIFYPCVFVPC